MTWLLVVGVAALGSAIPAPVSSVTVYSDRARVTRTAEVTVNGKASVSLPLLPDSVELTSIVVEAVGAKVERVDLARVAAEDFPQKQARELLAKLEQLDDEVDHASGERAVAAALVGVLAKLQPEAATGDELRPVPRLNSTNWVQALEFVDSRSERLQARIRQLDEKLIDLRHQRARLAAEAQLIGGAARQGGYRVTPTLAGQGSARVMVSYLVTHARWYPTYDLQLLPDKGRVQLSFAGQVSQETGEDWQDAQLTLSTAVPASSTRLPKLFTWKIGEQERFVPTPVAAPTSPPVTVATSPPGTTPSSPALGPGGEDQLRQRLLAYVQADADAKKREAATTESTEADGSENENSPGASVAAQASPQAEDQKEVPSANVLPRQEVPSADVLPDLERGPAPSTVTLAPSGAVLHARSRPPSQEWGDAKSEPAPVTVEVGLEPPPAWQAPTYAPELPVSLAGGYDLTFPSRRPETIQSGGGARRVALLSESWPVDAERRVYPALAAEAFLVATFKNPSLHVLPGGPAHLFVGADPAGTAALKLMAPGEAITLPLGVDRAIKATRNVKLSTWEKGVFSKDEITQYDVTMEVANPYRAPLKVGLTDQWPTTSDKNVEVKLLRADGAMQDHRHAVLSWNLTVPPSAKRVVSFTYTVRRPKGWRLYQ